MKNQTKSKSKGQNGAATTPRMRIQFWLEGASVDELLRHMDAVAADHLEASVATLARRLMLKGLELERAKETTA